MQRILDTINSPIDVKRLSTDSLKQLAEEIRSELIEVLARNGGHLGPNLGVVELTDNEWSIDKNVGSIADHLNRIVTNPRYAHLHEKAARFLEKLGGKRARRVAEKAEEAVKGMLFPSVIFEEFGFNYFGPLDGHDVGTLIRTFEFLKKSEEHTSEL